MTLRLPVAWDGEEICLQGVVGAGVSVDVFPTKSLAIDMSRDQK